MAAFYIKWLHEQRLVWRLTPPLHPFDTLKETIGSRHANPDICAKNRMPNVCAFVRKDNICLSPSKSWAKQFLKLKQQARK